VVARIVSATRVGKVGVQAPQARLEVPLLVVHRDDDVQNGAPAAGRKGAVVRRVQERWHGGGAGSAARDRLGVCRAACTVVRG
jgi:hypothetical protein